jgi:hypothetical protein
MNTFLLMMLMRRTFTRPPRYQGKHWASALKRPRRVSEIKGRLEREWEGISRRARQVNRDVWAGIYYSRNVVGSHRRRRPVAPNAAVHMAPRIRHM